MRVFRQTNLSLNRMRGRGQNNRSKNCRTQTHKTTHPPQRPENRRTERLTKRNTYRQTSREKNHRTNRQTIRPIQWADTTHRPTDAMVPPPSRELYPPKLFKGGGTDPYLLPSIRNPQRTHGLGGGAERRSQDHILLT